MADQAALDNAIAGLVQAVDAIAVKIRNSTAVDFSAEVTSLESATDEINKLLASQPAADPQDPDKASPVPPVGEPATVPGPDGGLVSAGDGSPVVTDPAAAPDALPDA